MKLKSLISLLIIQVALCSCGEPDYPTPTPSTTTLPAPRLNVVHTVVNGPRVQVTVDNRVAPKDTIRFERAPDGKLYDLIAINVPAGPNRVIRYADLAMDTLMATDRFTATSGQNFTAFVSRNGNGTSRIVRVTDDLSTPDVGFAKIRFLNFSIDAGEVQLTDEAAMTTVIPGRNFNEISRASSDFAKFIPIPAGTYSFAVRGIPDDDILFTITDLKLESKGIYTIYVKGLKSGADDLAISHGILKH